MSSSMEWYLDLSAKIAQGIGAHTNPKIQAHLEGIDGLEGQDIAFIQIGQAFAPDHLTVESFIERGPYANPENYKDQMDAAVERGWLESIKDNEYQLSNKGKKIAEGFIALGNEWFGSLGALSEKETSRIADLLAKLVKIAYQRPDPANKSTLEIGIRLNPGSNAASMLRVRRHLTDLAYYRDDAHIAAWQPLGVDGKVWETLTFLWRGEAATGAELAEQISQYRHYDEADYIAAFEELVSHGWAKVENGKYLITEKGKQVRQDAEDDTNQLFYAPFGELTKEEIEDLKTLLEKLAEALKLPEAEAEPL